MAKTHPRWKRKPDRQNLATVCGSRQRSFIGGCKLQRRPLGVHRGPDRPHRAGEGGEERVALGADLDPAVPDRPAQDGRVLVAHRPVAVAQVLEQPGLTLDVGEQEGHRSGGRAERPAGPDPLGGGHGHGDDPAEQGGRDHPGVAGQVQLAVVGAPYGQLRYGPG